MSRAFQPWPFMAAAILLCGPAWAQSQTEGSTQVQARTAPVVPPASDRSGGVEVSGVTVVVRRPAAVSDVTVTSRACPDPDPQRYPSLTPPRVVDSYPAPGAVIAPGYLTVRVTFDAPMACYWAVVSEGGDAEAPCEPSGSWELPARTTWRMQCKVDADAHYRIRFGAIDGHHFVGLSGLEAQGYDLRFKTTDGPAIASQDQALSADPGPPSPVRVSAYVTCTDRRFGSGEAPCVRRGLGQSDPAKTP